MGVEKNQLLLTIVFDAPFYKAIFESNSNKVYQVAQINLGMSEPKTPEILDLVVNNWEKVHFFEKELSGKSKIYKKVNPKRKQRLAKKSIKKGCSTKSQIVLKQQIEQNKLVNKKILKVEKEKLAEKKFNLKQIKRLEKHRGH